MSTRDDDKSDSKFNILRSATNLFAKLGLDKCSTREIAKQSDTNISLISYYFGGKEGLYKEVMREHALKTKQEAQEIIESFENADLTREVFVSEMQKMVDHMIQSRLSNPELAKIFAREKLAGFPFSKEIHSEIFYPLIQKFYKLFENGQKKGFVKEDVNPAVFFILMSEAIWAFYIIADCDIQIAKDCTNIKNDPKLLADQIMSIYVTGVLK
ncbi:MAG: TetR family transcriptional regulator [Pseudobdellovibrio sp.]